MREGNAGTTPHAEQNNRTMSSMRILHGAEGIVVGKANAEQKRHVPGRTSNTGKVQAGNANTQTEHNEGHVHNREASNWNHK